MKIAIYHNLEKGGALNSIIFLLKHLNIEHTIDLYCFKKNISKELVKKIFIYKTNQPKNIIQNLFWIIFNLKKINKNISKDINKKNYDLILVFPCIFTQSPYLLRYLKQKNKTIYFFTETKREFYENVSFDYWRLKKIISRLIRLPIKYIDKKNCVSVNHIISNSKYSACILKKIYNKKSIVIYPGLKPIKPKKIKIKNNFKILSVGQLSKIKGLDYSIDQIKGITKTLTLLGRKTNETKQIIEIAKKNNVVLNIIETENDDKKDKIYSKYSIYLANNLKEPFGITTLEATSNNCFVLGKKEGGTPEIIKNGVNGLLYSNIKNARKILKRILNQKEIVFYQINTIDWKYTSDKIIEYYNKEINHEN